MHSARGSAVSKYDLPNNLLSIQNLYLHNLPKGKVFRNNKSRVKTANLISECLTKILTNADNKAFEKLVRYTLHNKDFFGKKTLFDSELSWMIIRKMYDTTMQGTSFLDFFWSWRNLFGSLFSILLSDLPPASCYHSLCTGYAGIMLARAHFETGRPCLLTEHGIYTNERRIELSTADWLYDQSNISLAIAKSKLNSISGFHEMWTRLFLSYSSLCYDVCDKIITLYEGNRTLQISEGAPKSKTMVIHNGIKFSKFFQSKHLLQKCPTIAFIGRIVPVKDVKTFIRSVAIIKNSIPNIKAYILGSHDEDLEYYNECMSILKDNKLEDTLILTGEVNVSEYFKKIDLLVLTSLSEAQPLVIIECGAAGIPVVASDVGACREMIEGLPTESPKYGHGGIITPLSNAKSTAEAVIKLLNDVEFYRHCSVNIKRRVKKSYNIKNQYEAYNSIYNKLINTKNKGSN